MIVVVETNFILELALQQAHAEHAEAILQLAENKQIQLAVPAISFAESHGKLAALSKKRNTLYQDLRNEIKQMARSVPYAELETRSKSMTDALVSCATVHAEQFAKTADRLRACASVIPLTGNMIFEASILELIFDLKSGDAFVLASIHDFLKTQNEEASLFVTTDKDFQPVEDYLAATRCKLILGFPKALAAVRQELSEPKST